MDTSEIEQDEQRQLNRDLENNIIIRFRFHPDNYYEKQNGKRGIFEIHLLRIRKDIFVQKRERYFENSLDLLWLFFTLDFKNMIMLWFDFCWALSNICFFFFVFPPKESIIICKENGTTMEFAISFTDSDATADFW